MSRGGPRVGPAPALRAADPDADLEEVLAEVPQWECQDCGAQRFGRTDHCGECGSCEIEKVPAPKDVEP